MKWKLTRYAKTVLWFLWNVLLALAGLRFPKWLRRALLVPPIALLIATVSLSLGAVASIWSAEIRQAALDAFQARDWSALDKQWQAFFVTLGLWSVLTYYRLVADALDAKHATNELRRLVHRAPNPAVVACYDRTFAEIAARVQDAISTISEADLRTGDSAALERLRKSLVSVLNTVAGLAREFANVGPYARYRANIMLVAVPDAQNRNGVPSAITDRLRFVTPGQDLGKLSAILYLPAALQAEAGEEGSALGRPVFALPVPMAPVDALTGASLALPGAPAAMLSGKQSMHVDTSSFADACRHLGDAVYRQVNDYFGPKGEGRDIRSFVSFRIGSDKLPVGVLSIDADTENLLGAQPDYWETFYALMAPILHLLEDSVAVYGELSWAQGLFIQPLASAGGGLDQPSDDAVSTIATTAGA